MWCRLLWFCSLHLSRWSARSFNACRAYFPKWNFLVGVWVKSFRILSNLYSAWNPRSLVYTTSYYEQQRNKCKCFTFSSFHLRFISRFNCTATASDQMMVCRWLHVTIKLVQLSSFTRVVQKLSLFQKGSGTVQHTVCCRSSNWKGKGQDRINNNERIHS